MLKSSFPSTRGSCTQVKKIYENNFQTSKDKKHAFICGAASGVLATCAVHPLDLIRTRMALRTNDLTYYTKMIRDIIRTEGFSAFFKGLQANMIGMFIYKGISFFYFENLLQAFKESQLIQYSGMQQGISAGLASLFAQFITYPFDILKRRYMVLMDNEKQLFEKHDY